MIFSFNNDFLPHTGPVLSGSAEPFKDTVAVRVSDAARCDGGSFDGVMFFCSASRFL